MEGGPETSAGGAGTPPAAAGILREEIYDDAEHVNSLHLPIELGDVLERRSNGQLWVVLAQPCQLMVRGKGKREPELTHMMLARVERQQEGGSDLFSEFRLPYYFDGGLIDGVVKLGRPGCVRAVIVDACVLNEDGAARLDLAAESPARLLPHWRLRHEALRKVGNDLLKRVRSVKKDKPDMILGHYNGDPFPPTEVDGEDKCIEWDCRRVGRVGEPYARALLTRFSQYYARDAYLSDIAR
jgi:hypothetical protein